MDDQDLTGRGARQVFDDHLELRKRGDLEQDLARNYAPDVVVLTARGVLRGHDGVRESAALLYQAIRNADRYEYENASVRTGWRCWSGVPRDGPAPSATASTPT